MMYVYGRGRLRATTPDEEQPRPERHGKKQLCVFVSIPMYAQLDLACRRLDVSLSAAVREALGLWLTTRRPQP